MNYMKMFQVGLIKTLRFNIHYFGIKGLKLPVLVSRHTRLSGLGGRVRIETPLFGCIHIGFDGVGVFDPRDRAIWDNKGLIVFKGPATLGQGTRISNSGSLSFGRNFRITANSYIICQEEIDFGDNVLVSWECSFMDTDFHNVIDKENRKINLNKPISIGNNVWIGSKVSILKGTKIADNTVVAFGSLLTGEKHEKSGTIIATHAKIIKEEISWNP